MHTEVVNEHELGKQSLGSLRWSLPFFAVFLPIVLLSVYSLNVATESVQSVVESENLSAAGNLAQFITQDIKKNVELAHAVASVPGTISAIAERDEVAMRTRLKAITVSNSQVHRTYVVSTGGLIWNEFPTASGAYGLSVRESDWYKDMQVNQRPHVSGLMIREQFPDIPVVSIAVPAQASGTTLGYVVFEYDAAVISRWLKSVRLGGEGHLFVVDQRGALLAHPNLPIGGSTYLAYANIQPVKQAIAGDIQMAEYDDPATSERMLATFLPLQIGDNTWVVVAQQLRSSAFSVLDQVKFNLGVAGGILTLFTLFMVVALARTTSKNIQLNKDLEARNQSLKDFTSIVSHQLKAPITAMRWTLESMMDGDYGKLTTKMQEPVDTLYSTTLSNYRLVMDILNVSRLDRGVVAVETKPLPLKDVAERAIRDYTEAAERANLYLKIEDNGLGDTIVMVDLEKTAEAVTNSISNAIKYTKKGGISISLEVIDTMAHIHVTDTGEGMPPDMLEKLFHRSSVAKSNASAESSSGLGLYIAREFMRMQKGDITVTSEVGKGTTFTYTVPLVTKQQQAEVSDE